MIIFLNEKNLEINVIENEISHVKFILNNEIELKKLLATYMDRISKAVNNMTNPTDIETIHKCLADLKKGLDNVNNLITTFNELLTSLETLKTITDEEIYRQHILDYNCSYKYNFAKYAEVNTEVYVFINNLMQYLCIVFPEEAVKIGKIVERQPEPVPPTPKPIVEPQKVEETKKEPKPIVKETKIIEEQPKEIVKEITPPEIPSDLQEKTLLISEKRQLVILPYTIQELQELLEKYPKRYSSLQDVVDKEYTVPIEIYKNPSLSRFKEAFTLMKDREKRSLKDSFDLGLEVLFNSNLHPAIISACKSLAELDRYLDRLENDQAHTYDCFKIIFDMAPSVMKGKRS